MRSVAFRNNPQDCKHPKFRDLGGTSGKHDWIFIVTYMSKCLYWTCLKKYVNGWELVCLPSIKEESRMTIFDHLVLFWGQSALVQKYGSLVHLALIGNGFLRTPELILLVWFQVYQATIWWTYLLVLICIYVGLIWIHECLD